MKQLSRKKIQEMIDLNSANISSRRSSGGSGGGNGGGVSSAWVDEHYVSKDFFARLFTINGTTTEGGVNTDVVVEPNDLETTITNIQAMVGLWTEQYLSALGQGSGGGGGGGALLTEPLASINLAGLGVPSGSNKVIAWNGSAWTYANLGTGSGTVRSITAGTGLSGGTITTSGTIAISSDYQTKISHGETAYGWGNHADAGYLTASSSVITTLQGYFDTSGHAKSALKLTTVSKTAWGQTYWTSGGVPDTISGTLSDVGDIEMGNGNKIKWKNSSSTLLSFITLSSSNEFVLGESTAAQGYTTYLRGREIIFQSGYTNGSAVNNASLDTNGLFAVKKLKIGSIVISEDTTNGGLHIESAGIYADTYVSALGAGSGGGSGSGITMNDVWTAMAMSAPNESSQQIHVSHLAQALSGYVTLNSRQTISGTKEFYNANIKSNFGAKFGSMRINFNTSELPAEGEINRSSGSGVCIQYDNAYNVDLCHGGGSVKMQDTLSFSKSGTDHTMSASAKLTVSAGLLYVSAAMFEGNVPYLGGSDIRLKDVINPVTASVEDIANVRIFDFRWKKDGENGKIHFGSAAQDWQKIFPSAVVADKEGFLSMDYAGIAVGAVKTVAQEVVLLKKRVAELEKQLKAS